MSRRYSDRDRDWERRGSSRDRWDRRSPGRQRYSQSRSRSPSPPHRRRSSSDYYDDTWDYERSRTREYRPYDEYQYSSQRSEWRRSSSRDPWQGEYRREDRSRSRSRSAVRVSRQDSDPQRGRLPGERYVCSSERF